MTLRRVVLDDDALHALPASRRGPDHELILAAFAVDLHDVDRCGKQGDSIIKRDGFHLGQRGGRLYTGRKPVEPAAATVVVKESTSTARTECALPHRYPVRHPVLLDVATKICGAGRRRLERDDLRAFVQFCQR